MEPNTNTGKRSKRAIPAKNKKPDLTVSDDVESLVEVQRIAERKLYPLRIDQRTVIYVTKDKCTPEYAEKRRRQFGAVPVKEKKGGTECKPVDVEQIREFVQDGMYLKDIAKRLGVSKTTVDKYIQKYNLRENGRR